MRKIKFNDIRKSDNYLRHFEYLFSDYDLFRKKHFSNLCLEQLQPIFPDSQLFLTHSATGALEMIAHLLNITEGDEIIMPSFTFVSTANAFVSQGATPVFVDIDPETLNLDVDLVEAEITSKTKAIVTVHYAGHPCDLKRLSEICKKHNLFLIEDAAMGFGNQYQGQALGSYGDFGVISFDITKQISAVQGGLLLVNNSAFKERADIIYHIGTDRSAFQQGNKPYYEWVDVGSKFQMNELNAVALFDQLTDYPEILSHRKVLSELYFDGLKTLVEAGKIRTISADHLQQNYHEFYLILKDEAERIKLTTHLAEKGIEAMFHYIPLHNSFLGKAKGRSCYLPYTEDIASRLVRLPLHSELTEADVYFVCDQIKTFFHA